MSNSSAPVTFSPVKTMEIFIYKLLLQMSQNTVYTLQEDYDCY